jgi:hypothetical protein
MALLLPKRERAVETLAELPGRPGRSASIGRCLPMPLNIHMNSETSNIFLEFYSISFNGGLESPCNRASSAFTLAAPSQIRHGDDAATPVYAPYRPPLLAQAATAITSPPHNPFRHDRRADARTDIPPGGHPGSLRRGCQRHAPATSDDDWRGPEGSRPRGAAGPEDRPDPARGLNRETPRGRYLASRRAGRSSSPDGSAPGPSLVTWSLTALS